MPDYAQNTVYVRMRLFTQGFFSPARVNDEQIRGGSGKKEI